MLLKLLKRCLWLNPLEVKIHEGVTLLLCPFIMFFPNPPVGNENPFGSKPIPYPEYLSLSISAFFPNLTAPNKEFRSIESLLST